nr:hypothetical protein GCM10020093_001130 [Planobispora longispora]
MQLAQQVAVGARDGGALPEAPQGPFVVAAQPVHVTAEVERVGLALALTQLPEDHQGALGPSELVVEYGAGRSRVEIRQIPQHDRLAQAVPRSPAGGQRDLVDLRPSPTSLSS